MLSRLYARKCDSAVEHVVNGKTAFLPGAMAINGAGTTVTSHEVDAHGLPNKIRLSGARCPAQGADLMDVAKGQGSLASSTRSTGLRFDGSVSSVPLAALSAQPAS